MQNKNEVMRTVAFSRPRGNALIYLKHILLTMLLVAPAATIQAVNYYGSFEPRFFVAPFIVSLVVGSLLGRSVLLKVQLQEQGHRHRTEPAGTNRLGLYPVN